MRTTIALLMATLTLSACGGSAQETELTTAATDASTAAAPSEDPTEDPTPDAPSDASSEEAPAAPSEEPTADAATPDDEGSESVLDSVGGAPARVQEGELTGVLGGDEALEGGCAWIDGPDGRYEVQYPEGYTVEYGPVRLLGPDGEVVAEAGDTLTVTGALAEGMMSICQVGQLWTAESVTPA